MTVISHENFQVETSGNDNMKRVQPRITNRAHIAIKHKYLCNRDKRNSNLIIQTLYPAPKRRISSFIFTFYSTLLIKKSHQMSELSTATTVSFTHRGSRATRDGGFWHPMPQGDMKPHRQRRRPPLQRHQRPLHDSALRSPSPVRLRLGTP